MTCFERGQPDYVCPTQDGPQPRLRPCLDRMGPVLKTWNTAYFHSRTLRRGKGMWDANFFDVETEEAFWISGPKRDQTDGRYSGVLPQIDEDAREAYAGISRRRPPPWPRAGLADRKPGHNSSH